MVVILCNELCRFLMQLASSSHVLCRTISERVSAMRVGVDVFWVQWAVVCVFVSCVSKCIFLILIFG